jgi:transcriptional regulator with XRE-family HTH domain
MRAHSFDAYLKNALKDPKFRKGYEEEKRKLDVGYQVFLTRTKLGMTQAGLAHKIGTRQSNISRLEFGNYNFTVEMLARIARALGAELKIELLPPRLKKAA